MNLQREVGFEVVIHSILIITKLHSMQKCLCYIEYSLQACIGYMLISLKKHLDLLRYVLEFVVFAFVIFQFVIFELVAFVFIITRVYKK